MISRKEKTKSQFMLLFISTFIVALGLYFLLRGTYSWIPLIIPEFLGVTLLGILFLFAVKKSTKLSKFLLVSGGIFLLGVIGFIYGSYDGYQFLKDLSPELLGSTGLAIIVGLIFKKKLQL